MRKNKSNIVKIAIVLLVIIVVNVISGKVYKRFDLTKDKRYTLSQSALNTVNGVDSPVIVDVFLEGEFPSEFRRLRNETQQLLEL